MPVTPEQVRAAVGSVVDPELGRTLDELGMVREVDVGRRGVRVRVALPTEQHPGRDELARGLREAVRGLNGRPEVDVDWAVMSDDEQAALVGRLHEGSNPFARSSRTRVLLVASGKGGVGKSSVTVNLSVALARRGHRVACVDADVWGFSIPPMLGVARPPTLIGRMIVPPAAHGVRVASIGFFVREDQPVIWRGPMLHKALEQFLTDFYWDDPDFLVVDMPPGTGDVSLSLAQFLPAAEAYVVTTPQPAAQRVAQRAGLMFQSEHVGIPVRGVIENMSWFTGDDGTRYELFGRGGGQLLAERLGVPLLARIPLVPALREGGDVGRPVVVAQPDSEAAQAFTRLAEAIAVDLAPSRRYHPKLRVV